MQPFQPPSPQPSQPIEPRYPPQHVGPSSPPPKSRRLVQIAVAVVAAVAVLAVALYYMSAVYLPAAQEAATQPRITITDAGYYESGCGFFGPYYRTFTWTFSLVNTGDADGFAVVTFTVNGEGVGQDTYHVPAGTSVEKTGSVRGPDHGGWPCPDTDNPNLSITQVTKA